MRERREWVEVDHDILVRHADNTGEPLEWLASREDIIGGIEKRCRDACGRSSRVVHIPQGVFQGKKLRQRRQAKRLRVAQVVLLGCDGQLLHILDGLKVVWSEFEAVEDLLVVGVCSKAKSNLVPKSLILKSLESPHDCDKEDQWGSTLVFLAWAWLLLFSEAFEGIEVSR